MKGYKGFDKNLKCRDKQYKIGRTEREDAAELCNKGMHFCTNPHDIFQYYSAGDSRFCEVTASEVSDEKEDDSKRVCKTLRVEAEISVFQICRIAVRTFFGNFGFKKKIEAADTANAGDRGAANAGDRGAANAGNYGAASVGENGVAIVSTNGKAKGCIGSVLVLVNRDDYGNITEFKAVQVDGKEVKENTWYMLDNGELKEAE